MEDNSCNTTPSKVVASSQAQPLRSSSTYGLATTLDHDEALSKVSISSLLDDGSAYSVSTSRFLRVSTNPGVVPGNAMVEDMASPPQDPPEDFLLVRHSDLAEKIYLFARTCREKEAWFRRLRGASIGKPLLTTTQQASHHFYRFINSRKKPIPLVPSSHPLIFRVLGKFSLFNPHPSEKQSIYEGRSNLTKN